MSEQGTADLAERSQLEWDLGAAARTKPTVQLVNDLMPIQPGDWVGIGVSGDPNSTAPQTNLIRDILYAKATDETADMADRRSAAEVLRLSYNERIKLDTGDAEANATT